MLWCSFNISNGSNEMKGSRTNNLLPKNYPLRCALVKVT